ncbi:MAG: hypothetical protein J2P45_08305 [Candidatus Dormibacteraeota bacterium]|nr:hypothetical protein [Candidatus Dormibacteraeota bacterium]
MSTSDLADRLHRPGRQLLAASLLAALVATGCGQQSMLATSPAAPAGPQNAQTAVSLLHDAGEAPITGFIQGAQRSLDCELYMVTDRDLADALGQAAGRSVRVRVILEPKAGSTQLVQGKRGVDVVPPPQGVALDHTKSCVRDAGTASAEVLVGTANWSRSAVEKNADLVATLPGADPAAQQVAATIEADVTGQPVPSVPGTLSGGDEAVISPVNARALLSAFAAQPGDRLLVTSEELRDTQLLAALTGAGVEKRVEVAAPSSERTPAGAHRCSSNLYMHAKVMVLWRQGQPAAAFLGSENLSTASLDRNREIGVIGGPSFASAVWRALQPELDCDGSTAGEPAQRSPRPRASEGR